MQTYTYIDMTTAAEYAKCKVVFTCKAANIADADTQYESTVGTHPSKQSKIGCQIGAEK